MDKFKLSRSGKALCNEVNCFHFFAYFYRLLTPKRGRKGERREGFVFVELMGTKRSTNGRNRRKPWNICESPETAYLSMPTPPDSHFISCVDCLKENAGEIVLLHLMQNYKVKFYFRNGKTKSYKVLCKVDWETWLNIMNIRIGQVCNRRKGNRVDSLIALDLGLGVSHFFAIIYSLMQAKGEVI